MIHKKLKKIREFILKNNYAGYIISTTDEYLSEYTPEHAKRLEYITGFSGSNGIAIILHNTVLFFTDGRYLDQSFAELDKNMFKIFDQQLLKDFTWGNYIKSEDIIAYDSKLFSRKQLQHFKNIKIKAHADNFIDQIWEDQPKKPSSNIYDYSVEFSGAETEDKIIKCREFIRNNNAEALLITNSDCVCWALNIRAHDIEFSPLLLANSIITHDKIYLFTDATRYENNNQKNIIILPEEEFENTIDKIRGKILFDKNLCSDYISTLIEKQKYQNITNPCIAWKAQKNLTELNLIKDGHIHDAVAVCEILAFIDSRDISSLSEFDIGEQLTQMRAKAKSYIMDSFPAICGFQDNGAIIHYRAKQDTAKKLAGDGLLLIDSGGQYKGATTDITRTVAIGAVSKEHKENYTQVLKGHIALARATFPENKVTGANLDILARQFLWQEGKDYAHGTGHGVGSFLSVHEGPQSISLAGTSSLIKEGMVISNEPGYYVPGEYGIRIENIMYTKKSNKIGFLEFEMLTLVPYAKNLIIKEMLSKDEISYIQNYYKNIEKLVYPKLSKAAKTWLKEQLF